MKDSLPRNPAPRTHDRMAGAYCKPWCIYCRRAPGLDCTDTARPTKWRRKAEKAALRRYLTATEEEMSWKAPQGVLELREAAEREGYDATIRPWSGHGWEIFNINGPGITDGATQAHLIDEVEYMVRNYVATMLDLYPDDNPSDDWDEENIPVRLTLSLEPRLHTGSRANVLEVKDPAGEKVVLVEEVIWWTEAADAE